MDAASTEAAVRALYRKLRPGGEFFFYLYKRMGAARQFCDEYIRREFSKLSPEACLEECRALTEMGRELSRLGATITLKQPIKVLGASQQTTPVNERVDAVAMAMVINSTDDDRLSHARSPPDVAHRRHPTRISTFALVCVRSSHSLYFCYARASR